MRTLLNGGTFGRWAIGCHFELRRGVGFLVAQRLLMEKTTYSVVVTWREGKAQIYLLSDQRFDLVRQSWIDEGYFNLQTEWYERSPDKLGSVARYRVFAYWEGVDESPSRDQLQAWGRRAPALELQT